MDRKFKLGDYVNIEDVYDDCNTYKIIGFCDHHKTPFYVLDGYPHGAAAEQILKSDFYQTVRSRIDKTITKPVSHTPKFKTKERIKFKSDRFDMFLIDDGGIKMAEAGVKHGKISKVFPAKRYQTDAGISCHHRYTVSYRDLHWSKQDSFNLFAELIIGACAAIGILLGTLKLIDMNPLFVLVSIVPVLVMAIAIAEKFSHFINQFKARYTDLMEHEIRKFK